MTWETMKPRERDAWLHEAMGRCAHIWQWVPDEYRNECSEDENHDVAEDATLCPDCGAVCEKVLEDYGDYPPKVCKKCGQRVAGLAYVVSEHPNAPPYHKDLAAALGLLEEMRKRPFSVKLNCTNALETMARAEADGTHERIHIDTLWWLLWCCEDKAAAICECVYRALADCPAAARGDNNQ